MLNQLTIRDFDKRIQKFDFEELLKKESPAEIAKAVFNRVSDMSESYNTLIYYQNL